MSTWRRRDLKPGPLSASARTLLDEIRRADPPGFPREVVARSKVQRRWVWGALAQLQERGYVRLNDFGHVQLVKGKRAA